MLRRRIARAMVLVVGLLTVLACAPAANPAPAAVTAEPTRLTAAKPAQTVAANSAAEPAWKTDWDATVAAAKKEGNLKVSAFIGDGWRQAVMRFQDDYPDIKIEYTGMLGGDAIPKILAERRAGLYLWDVWVSGPTNALEELMPAGALAPLRPVLVLPEVLDDNAWHQGFDDGWADKGHQYLYGWLGYLSYVGLVNRAVTPKSELSTLDQLLDPTWKGKIAWVDPRKSGTAQFDGAHLLNVKGEAWYRKLLTQDIVFLADGRALLEGLERGRYAIALGTSTGMVGDLRREGLLANAEYLEPDTAAGARITGGSGFSALFNNAPHPNAAKVFSNWILSRDGMESFAKLAVQNTRRLDVTQVPGMAPRPGVKYDSYSKEENMHWLVRALEIQKELIK